LESSCRDATSFEITLKELKNCIGEVEKVIRLSKFAALGKADSKDETKFTSADYVEFKNKIFKFQEKLNSIPLSSSKEATFSGEYIYKFLNDIGINHKNYQTLDLMLEKAISIIQEEKGASKNVYLSLFTDLFKVVFGADTINDPALFKKSYKLYIFDEEKPADPKNPNGPTFCFWCFNSGIAMKGIVDQGCRSIILASGTLSPLESFAFEMQMYYCVLM